MGSSTFWSHQTRLPAEPLSASRARAFVSHHLVEHRLMQPVNPLRLVASELATNALLHAGTPFTVTLSETDNAVRLAVKDDSSAPPGPRAPQVMDMGGHRLAIVGVLSQHWGVSTDHRGAKTVWACFPNPRKGSP